MSQYTFIKRAANMRLRKTALGANPAAAAGALTKLFFSPITPGMLFRAGTAPVRGAWKVLRSQPVRQVLRVPTAPVRWTWQGIKGAVGGSRRYSKALKLQQARQRVHLNHARQRGFSSLAQQDDFIKSREGHLGGRGNVKNWLDYAAKHGLTYDKALALQREQGKSIYDILAKNTQTAAGAQPAAGQSVFTRAKNRMLPWLSRSRLFNGSHSVKDSDISKKLLYGGVIGLPYGMLAYDALKSKQTEQPFSDQDMLSLIAALKNQRGYYE